VQKFRGQCHATDQRSVLFNSPGHSYAIVQMSLSCKTGQMSRGSVSCNRPKGQYYSIFQAILMPQSRRHCHAKQARCPEVSVMQQTNGQNCSIARPFSCYSPDVIVMQNGPDVQKSLSCKTDQMSRSHCHAKRTRCPEVSVMQRLSCLVCFLVGFFCFKGFVKSKNSSIVRAILMQQSRSHCHEKQTRCPEVIVTQQTNVQYYSLVQAILMQNRPSVQRSCIVMQQTNGQYYSIVQAILMQQSRCPCHAKKITCRLVSCNRLF
jgi:hypothetical protein